MTLNSYPFFPPIKKTITMNSFTIRVATLELFKFIEIQVTIYDQDENPCDSRFYKIEGDEYKAWMEAQDDWLISYVKIKLREENEK